MADIEIRPNQMQRIENVGLVKYQGQIELVDGVYEDGMYLVNLEPGKTGMTVQCLMFHPGLLPYKWDQDLLSQQANGDMSVAIESIYYRRGQSFVLDENWFRVVDISRSGIFKADDNGKLWFVHTLGRDYEELISSFRSFDQREINHPLVQNFRPGTRAPIYLEDSVGKTGREFLVVAFKDAVDGTGNLLYRGDAAVIDRGSKRLIDRKILI